MTGAVPSGFFVLRTPLLPFDELRTWSAGLEAPYAVGEARLAEALAADRARLRARLAATLTGPEIRDAIFLASPRLEAALDGWRDGAAERDGTDGRLEPVLASYFLRAAARPTPFGLFAGCTTGTLGTSTSLRLVARAGYRRHTRLDMDYLLAVTEAMGREKEPRNGFLYRPNSSLYTAGDRIRLVAAHQAPDTGRSHHLVAVEKSSYLADTLERAGPGATFEALAGALVDAEISREDAEAYIAELIEAQVVVPNAAPRVTGAGTLDLMPAGDPAADQLRAAQAALAAIDAEGLAAPPARYRAVAGLLTGLPVEPRMSRLAQVDMVKPAAGAVLGTGVVAELTRGVALLRRIAPPPAPDDLGWFRREFVARYGTRSVPLAEALDEEAGIGFAPPAEESRAWSERDDVLLELLTGALTAGAHEIVLGDADLDRLSTTEPPLLPDAFHVMAAVAAASEEAVEWGELRVRVDRVTGPSGATLLGRFCSADPDLDAHVRAHLRSEEARRPEAVFAEIVHLPAGRVGNILHRPVLRNHEIPFLGTSGAAAEAQIPVSDLVVSVEDDRVVLRSRKLGRPVIPRLTSAHDHRRGGLGVYRFLCQVGNQGVATDLAWDWGCLAGAPFLPRVATGRLVLAPARWNLSGAELDRLRAPGTPEGFAGVQAWRSGRRLPRHVALVDDDRELVIDLDNVLCLEVLAHQVRGLSSATLVELFPGPDDLCVTGPEGRFVHELVVPFAGPARPAGPATIARQEEQRAPRRWTPPVRPLRRRFPPGSEWLYAKLYGGDTTAERVLTEMVAPLARDVIASGAAERWFFVRYADPDPHLRVRFSGDRRRLHGEVMPALSSAAAALVDGGLLWRVQLDTYEREVERYGGDAGIELAEGIFAADSEAALAVVGATPGDAGLDPRRRLALCGVDRLLRDLGLSVTDRRAVVRRGADRFAAEAETGAERGAELGLRFRRERAGLEALLGGDGPAGSPGAAAFDIRSARVAPLAAELKARAAAGSLTGDFHDVALSLAHMHVNRMLRPAPAGELVIYEFLDRIYASQAARGKADR